MLTAMRNRAKGFTAKIIMALLIVSFAVWGIGDMLVSRPEQAEVARIGKVTISRLALEREMQRDISQLRERLGEQYKPEILQMLNIPQQVAGRMVAQELIRQESEALGVIPSDKKVADVLRHDQMFQNDAGNFDKEIFLRVLRQNGLSEREFVTIMREDIARRLIGQVVTGNFGVPDIAVKVVEAAQKETRDITLYSITPKKLEEIEPTDEELEAYYETVSDRFAIPEYRTVSYVEINEKDIKADINVSNEDVQALFDERIEEYKSPETKDIQLLLYNEKEEADKARALLLEGKSGSDIAKDMPPLNASNMVIKGTTNAQLTDEMQPIVSALGGGEVSEPIATDFGFHVIKVDKVNAPTTKSFASVEQSLRAELEGNHTSQLLTQQADALEDLIAGGSSLNEAAKELGLTVNTVDMFDQVGKSPSGKAVKLPELKNFVPLAFNTNEGEGSAVSLGAPGTYFLVYVDKVQAETIPPIETVKKDLIKGLKESRNAALRENHARTIAAKLADDAERETVLASGEAKNYLSGKMERSDLKLGGKELPAMLVQSIFDVNVGEVTPHSKLSDGRYVVAMVSGSQLPPLAQDTTGETSQTIRSNIQADQQQELMQQFMGHLYKKYDVVIHQDVVQQIGRSDS